MRPKRAPPVKKDRSQPGWCINCAQTGLPLRPGSDIVSAAPVVPHVTAGEPCVDFPFHDQAAIWEADELWDLP